jgi:hypothetical protein
MSKPRSKKLKKTAFVPRGLFVGALTAASVIPVCACGGSVANSQDGGNSHDTGVMLHADVAAQGFDGRMVMGVAMRAFDAGTDAMLGSDGPAVAVIGFDGSDGQFGVAVDAFGGADVASMAFDGG